MKMSEWVRSLFGFPSPDASSSSLRDKKDGNDTRRSLTSLEEAKKMTRDRIGYLDMKIASSIEHARTNAKSGRKADALLWLKRKRLYESQKTHLSNMETNIETQMMAIDSMATTQIIYGSIKSGAETMKTMTQKIDVDDVAETMKEIDETMIEMDEISAAMAAPFSKDVEIDESDLMDELESLMQETDDPEFDRIMGSAPNIKTIPKASFVAETTTLRPKSKRWILVDFKQRN